MISTILIFLLVTLKIVGYYFVALWHTIVPGKPKDIREKLVLVTGGRRGIGKALALEFATHGANIVLWDIDKDETEQAAEEIKSSTGVKVRSYVCDVTDTNKVMATAAQIKKEMGKVDILVNNAGISNYGSFLDRSEDEIVNILNVNVLSHIWMLRQFLPDMLKSGEGHILAMASLLAFMGRQNVVHYCTAKYAVRGLCESIERELKVNYNCTDIKVSVLCPGAVDTHMLSNHTKQGNLHRRKEEIMSPEYVAKLAVVGVLRNQRFIFAPPYMSAVPYLKGRLPHNAFELLKDILTPERKTDN